MKYLETKIEHDTKLCFNIGVRPLPWLDTCTKRLLNVTGNFYRFRSSSQPLRKGEIGYSSMKVYFDDGYGRLGSEQEGGFTYAPTIGAQFGTFEIGLRYESTALGNVTLSGAMLRLGFNF